MPDSTSALINMLANPPNPFAQAGQAIEGVNKLRQYQADAAAADAYKQSIDPVTGQFDQQKFNAIASQAPGGAWNFGRQMQSSGTGLQSQALGSSADVQAKLDQQSALSTYLQPLTQTVINNGTVTGQQVSDMLATVPPGLIPPTRMKAIQAQIDKIGPTGDASNFVLGAAYANQHAIETTRQMLPNYGTIQQGTYQLPIQGNPRAQGGSTYPTAPIPMGPSPAEAIGVNERLGTPVQGGWTDPKTGDHKEGTLAEYYQDFGIKTPPPIVGTMRPGPDGTFTFPGAIPGAPTVRIAPPAAAPGAPGPARYNDVGERTGPPAPAGGRPAPGPPPRGGPPEPSPYITPPAPERRGGTVVPPAGAIAAGINSYNTAIADLPNSQDRAFQLRQALTAMEGAKTGRGTEGLQTLNSLLGTWSPEWLNKGLGIKPQEMAKNYDESAKYYQRIANAANPGGALTNDKLAAAITANPGVHMNDLAAKEITQVMLAGEEMHQYVTQKALDQKVPPANFAKYRGQWALENDPRAFILQHISDPAKLQKLSDEINSGSPSGKKLKATIQQAVKDGAIPDPTRPRGP